MMKLLGSGLQFSGAVAIGAAAVLLAPVVLPFVSAVVKPMLKGMIKGGIVAYESVKVALAETKESIEDITAEAKSEIAEARKAPAPKATRKAASAAA